MTVNETIKRIGSTLRRQTEETTAAPLPNRMLEIIAKLEENGRTPQRRVAFDQSSRD